MWEESLKEEVLNENNSKTNLSLLGDKIVSSLVKSYDFLLFATETSIIIGAEYFFIYRPYLDYLSNK
ncbi:hypothetical protein K9L16_02020 [Candidatus Pacearchaeota archaeon]|nr:hypothetical protein [Candidatus Pacearchaeota archaeon]